MENNVDNNHELLPDEIPDTAISPVGESSLMINKSIILDSSVVEFEFDNMPNSSNVLQTTIATSDVEPLQIINHQSSEELQELSMEVLSLQKVNSSTTNCKDIDSNNSNPIYENLKFQDTSEILKEKNEDGQSELVTEIFNTAEENVKKAFLTLSPSDQEDMSNDNLISWIKELENEKEILLKKNQQFQKELDAIISDQTSHTYQAQIEDLERQLLQSKADQTAHKIEMENKFKLLTKENVAVRDDMTSRLERLMTQYESANKDKESMVMKYAMAEKEVIVVKKQKDVLEKKFKEVEKDKELLQGKIKSLSLERSKICNTLDNKIQENGVSTRLIDKLRDEIAGKDVKIKWGLNKVKSESEAHKETQSKLERALVKICNHEEEVRSINEEAEKIVRDTKEGELTRANILDKQLREHKALLIMEKQKHEDVAALYKQIKAEHESLRSSNLLLETEATTLRVKVSKYEAERIESEKLFRSLQSEMRVTKEGAADLSQQLIDASTYVEQIERQKNRADSAERKVKELEAKVEELLSEVSGCREKEAELLSFTQKLTDKNVFLQSQLTSYEGKNKLFEIEHEGIKSESADLLSSNSKLEKELRLMSEAKLSLEQKLSLLSDEKEQTINQLKTKVSDLLNELQVQQKKYQNAMKDTHREVQKLRKKLDGMEKQASLENNHLQPVEETIEQQPSENSSYPSSCPSQDSISRASSDTSLNGIEPPNGTVNLRKSPTSPIYDMPQQVLIERILKLQKQCIKRSEKMDFLEEHVSQLLEELQKKNKIINHYILREQSGALVNRKSDAAKSANAKLASKMTQAEIMKHGGIMASVYGSTPMDESMTLDLSLEINRKLQAVLEDTLLKNITLKDNLNTLGEEVAKLAHDNSMLKT